MKSGDITSTDGRLIQALKNTDSLVSANKQKQIVKEMKKEVDGAKIQLGKVTKFYPYLDKAEVTDDGKKIMCKVLHRCWGNILDFFTPQGDRSFDDTLKEPCIIPFAPIPCLYADINDNTKEHLLLGYYADSDIIYNIPAEQGTYKLVNTGSTNQYYMEFGGGSFEVFTPEGLTVQEGVGDDTNDVEHYTKREVDAMLFALREEIGELKEQLKDKQEQGGGDEE